MDINFCFCLISIIIYVFAEKYSMDMGIPIPNPYPALFGMHISTQENYLGPMPMKVTSLALL